MTIAADLCGPAFFRMGDAVRIGRSAAPLRTGASRKADFRFRFISAAALAALHMAAGKIGVEFVCTPDRK